MTRLTLMTALGVLIPCAVAAQSFDGAYVSLDRLSFSSYDDYEGVTEFYGTSIASIGGQFTFGSGVGLSADLTNYGGDIRDSAVTLHAFYRINTATAIGAFYGYDTETYIDRVSNDDPYSPDDFVTVDLSGNYYGAEGRLGFGASAVEVFIGEAEGDLQEGAMYGISGGYRFGSWTVTADYSSFDGDYSVDKTSRFSVGGLWNYSESVELWTEIGRRDFTYASPYFDDGYDFSQDFVAVGIRIGLGPNGGTTFGPRSFRENFF